MSDHVRAIILGVIEGLSEFLPISSTGHMLLAMPLLDISAAEAPWSTLLWVSQFGAILAVIVYFWRDLWRRTFRPASPGWRRHLLTKLVVAMIPTVVLALLLKKWLDPLEQQPLAVAAALVAGGVALWAVDRWFRHARPQELEDVTLTQAALIGAVQCVSMWPGFSRSGASIMGGMLLGLTPRVAAEFSFYLAIPTMLAAGVKTVWDQRATLSPDNAGVIVTGTVTSFVVALVVVAAFMEYVKRYRFWPFVVYRVLLGAAVVAYYYAAGR
ncbi:MAG: undecaprenyl-diphosphate phosphatase [Phycisphaerae bacterium]|nr:undecaprenyl-diphosphate phosphatase [Phycisphaerae bacterium]MCZ2398738.1 undecaprenyl-diphosphate phosphatase [Phycisphaerae bacterium]NUQ48606.1 undecaprenyl-diphosphate phosphatase [Phycisphaerae bacterium]